MKKIIDYLQQLGLSEIEAVLYKGLLETGATTVKDLAEHVNVKRITAHFNIERLIERGLVTQVKKGLKRNIVAEPPDRLADLIKKQEQDIEIMKNNFQDTLTTLYSIIPTTKKESGVDVRYFEGKASIKSVYQQVLQAKRIYSFVNVNKIQEVFPENSALFKKAFDNNPHMEMWEIIEDTRESRDTMNALNKRYHYSFVPHSITLSDFDFMIFDDHVAMVYVHEVYPYAVVINSSAMANGLQAIHQMVWDVLSTRQSEK